MMLVPPVPNSKSCLPQKVRAPFERFAFALVGVYTLVFVIEDAGIIGGDGSFALESGRPTPPKGSRAGVPPVPICVNERAVAKYCTCLPRYPAGNIHTSVPDMWWKEVLCGPYHLGRYPAQGGTLS